MDKYMKIFFLFALVYHRIDQLWCEDQINDGPPAEKCEVGFYRCKNSTCINESLLCNGQRDCPNGDDEEGCVFVGANSSFPCAKTDGRCNCVGDKLITLNCTEAGLVSLPILINKRSLYAIYIKGNKIPKLTSSGTFNGLVQLDTLTLQHNEIDTIESDTFAGLGVSNLGSESSVSVDLSGNNITRLTSKMFQTLHLSNRLSLTENQISTIENDTFVDLTIQDSLELNGNKLTKLTPEMFAGLKKTVGLYLQDNQINVIENNTFVGIKDLTVLNLSGNKITKLTSGMFGRLDSLFDLYLQGNEIDTIENNTFDSLPRLSILNLRGNKLSKLNPTIFDASPILLLQSLDLSGNGISIIERNTFNSLTALEILDLSHNNLTKLEAYIFENNKKLKQLSLSGNEISHIEPSTFDGLINLQILNLSNNPLHDVDKNLFNHNTELNNLFVDDLHVCCHTKRTYCNANYDSSYFCANHTIAYTIGGIFLLVIIIVVIFFLKKYSARHKYTVPSNQAPDHL